MTDVVIDRIRLRGPGTARLARIAARALPAALDRALQDLGDADIADLAVPLDAAVLSLDDDAVAALWADAIRGALLAEGVTARRPPPGPEPAPAADGVADTTAPRTGEEDRAEASAWVREHFPRTGIPVSALRRARMPSPDGSPMAGVTADDAALRERVRHALSEELRPRHLPAGAPDPGRTGSAASDSPPDVRDGVTDPVEPKGTDAAPAAAAPRAPGLAGAPGADPSLALDALIDALADLVADRGGRERVDLRGITRAAGLPLLYPWLADHCRAAVEALPGELPAAVRAVALAALIDEDAAALRDDPLVRHLAGLRPEDPPVPSPAYDTTALRDAAADVVRSFAALLPGFQHSSTGFVRDEWLRRPGLLDLERDPALLTARSLPLDIALGTLPYPIGLFALPWCRPVTVRFRP